jgi:soluble lytic murein transglycosylase-like protein
MYEDFYEEEELYAENGFSPLYPLLVLIAGVFLILLFDGGNAAARADNNPAFFKTETQSSAISPVFTPEVRFWDDEITQWATETGLDPNLIATVMQIESCGNPRATSRAGAKGLFQVMPYHFSRGENPYYPDINALRGLDYLKKSLNSANGNFYLAFAGYNGGIGVIALAESAWADETKRYAYWGSGIYADAQRGVLQSARLEEWLAHGGASLCAQARKNQ